MSRLAIPKTCGRCDQLITTTEELDRHDLRHLSAQPPVTPPSLDITDGSGPAGIEVRKGVSRGNPASEATGVLGSPLTAHPESSPAALGATTGEGSKGSPTQPRGGDRGATGGSAPRRTDYPSPAGDNILPFQPRFDVAIPADNGDRRPICVACLHSAGSVLRKGEAYCGACALMWGPYDLTDALEDWHESHLSDQGARW